MNAKRETNEPPRVAVALRYDPEAGEVPDVVGKGTGEAASQILKIAEEHGIPVREDPDLLELLAGVRLGDAIPVELYEVVAEVLTFLYRVNEAEN